MKARVLPPEEWHRVDAASPLPPLWPYVRPEDVRMVVVEEAGEIVGALAVLRMTHLEGLWLAPEYRGNPGVVRGLLKQAGTVASEWAAGWVFAGVTEQNMQGILGRMGATQIPVEVFMLQLGQKAN